MSLDLVTLSVLTKELKDKLIMGKITKINQPEVDELRLIVRNNGENYTLSISANPTLQRITLTNFKKTNPETCPNFCMLLRKYLVGAIIENITIENDDRIVKITFLGKDELLYERKFYVYCELINRYSNVIFCNESGVIMSALRTLSIDNSQKRPIFAGIKYEFLPSNQKPSIFKLKDYKEKIEKETPQNLTDYLMANFCGITKANLEILLKSPNVNYDLGGLITVIDKLNSGENCGLQFYVTKDNEAVFSFETMESAKRFDYLFEAIDYQSQVIDEDVRLKEKTKNYYNLLRKYIIKTEKKIKINQNKLVECDGKDVFKKYGELLTSNMYQIKKGMKEITVYDYYLNQDITLPLDEKLSPKENAGKYYKKYTKLKNAEEVTKQQLELNKTALTYANSILAELDNLSYGDSTMEIESELEILGIFKRKRKKKKDTVELLTYEVDGNVIIVGKNNLQNDLLTFKIANAKDIWCHVKSSHGSHVVVFRKNDKISDTALKVALELAAYYSKNNGGKVEVDYTERKNVQRIDQTHKGLVYYVNYKTALVTPSCHEEYLKKD